MNKHVTSTLIPVHHGDGSISFRPRPRRRLGRDVLGLAILFVIAFAVITAMVWV